jgi:hypothetical protein
VKTSLLGLLLTAGALFAPVNLWAYMAMSFGSDEVVYVEAEGWYNDFSDILLPKSMDLDGDGVWDAGVQNSMMSYGAPGDGFMGAAIATQPSVWVYGFAETTGSHETGDLFTRGCASPFAAGEVLPRVEDDPTRWGGNNPATPDNSIIICATEQYGGNVSHYNTGLNASYYRSRYYLGLALEKPEGFYYAWVEVFHGGRALIQVQNYAYETEPNKTLVFGAIPEPSTIALLAAGGLLLALRRKHK